MADSYRLDVLKRLTALLEATVVTPYPNLDPALPATLAGCVFRGRSIIGDEEKDKPAIVSILENPKHPFSLYAGSGEARSSEWQLMVQGACTNDRRNPSDPVYSMADDVEKRFDRINQLTVMSYPKYPEDYMLGGQITQFEWSDPVIRPPTEGISRRCFFYFILRVGLARTPS